VNIAIYFHETSLFMTKIDSQGLVLSFAGSGSQNENNVIESNSLKLTLGNTRILM